MKETGNLRNRLKLRQLNLLAALGEVGSLHKAAAQLGMTQPAATRLLRELEETMEAPLFERSSRGLHPTDMGRLLIRHATMFVSGIDHIQEEAHALKAGNAGSLKIGLFPGAWPLLLPRAIMLLKQQTPRIEIEIQDGTQEALLTALRAGTVQVIIGRTPDGEAAKDLTFDVVLRETFSVVCRREHPSLTSAGTHTLADLIDHRWILPLPQTPLRDGVNLQWLSQCGRLPTDIIESVSVTTNLALLWESDYVALMPKSIARYYTDKQLVDILVDTVPGLVGPVSMITLATAARAKQVERFADALRAAVAAN